MREAFHQRHEALYTYSERHSAVEVVNVESTLNGRVDRPKRMSLPPRNGAAGALKGHRPMILAASGTAAATPVCQGDRLGAGDRVTGPAVIEEVTTPIVIEPGWVADLHETGVYGVTPG